MAAVTFRFYGSLGDFLERRTASDVAYVLDRPVSVKDAVESLGVPHPEIDLLLANGASVDFSYRLQQGDRIAVYPRFESIDVHALSLVRPPALESVRFVLDAHLGRLAAYLRLAGFDALYAVVPEKEPTLPGVTPGDEKELRFSDAPPGTDDEVLAKISSRERRVLLTRDIGLLKRSIVVYGYWVRETNPRRQLREIAARFALGPHARPFTRCLRCNTPIEPVSKDAVLHLLSARTRLHYDEFFRCPGCGRVYWKGSHWEHLRSVLDAIETD